jgi:CBS-domain-containing membrane protein
MFSVYGTSGQLFRGSIEQLRQIGGVGALARTHGVQAVGRDGRDAVDDFTGAVFSEHALIVHRQEPRSEALVAYSQAQQGTTQRHPLSRVADLMSPRVISLPDSASVWQAWQLLAQSGVGQAPVVDLAGHLVGMLTRADLLKHEHTPTPDTSATTWRTWLQQNVKKIMWTPVPSVDGESDIRRVAGVLLETGLPGLPVVDEQGLVTGFISRSDILRAIVTEPPLDLWG